MDKSDEFVVTGLQKYLDAVSAVNIFEKEIQRRVKSAVDKRQPELSELNDYLYSSELPKSIQIGQQVPFKGFGKLYFYLYFSRDDSDRSCVEPTVCFNRDRRDSMKSLWDSATAIKEQSQNEDLGISRDSIWMTSGQPCTDWNSCKSVFDEVIDGWIGLWKALGGIKKYLAS